MIPFTFTQFENIYKKLLKLVFSQICLKKTTSIANRLKKDWIENKENHDCMFLSCHMRFRVNLHSIVA